MKLTAIDLFSGCGGLTQGLKKAGFRVLAGVEIREHARKTYLINHKNVKLYEDIRNVIPTEMMTELGLKKGELDLLAGCPPCQGFSTMRTKNKGTPSLDERNELIFEILRLVESFMPKTIMIENVPGLKEDWRMKVTQSKLETFGYCCVCEVVNAADFGVPQRRKRMILLASRLANVEIKFRKVKLRTVKDAIGELPHPRKSTIKLHSELLPEHNEEVMERIRNIPKNGGSRGDLGSEDQLDCHKVKNIGFKDVYGRMSWNKVAPTITRFCVNPSKGRFLHPSHNRAITLYEASLLQGFPRSYRFPINLGRGSIASMIGEALPPLLAQKQAEYLLKHINKYSQSN